MYVFLVWHKTGRLNLSNCKEQSPSTCSLKWSNVSTIKVTPTFSPLFKNNGMEMFTILVLVFHTFTCVSHVYISPRCDLLRLPASHHRWGVRLAMSPSHHGVLRAAQGTSTSYMAVQSYSKDARWRHGTSPKAHQGTPPWQRCSGSDQFERAAGS